MTEPLEKRWIPAPDGVGGVWMDNFGEHHMGAEHIRLRVDPPGSGRASVQGTNCRAAFSPCGRWLLLFDSVILVVLDRRDECAGHFTAPYGRYLGELRCLTDRVHVELWRDSTPRTWIDAGEYAEIIRRRPGWGPVRDGRLPSLHLPAWISEPDS